MRENRWDMIQLLDSDLLKFFLRGLRWEIRACVRPYGTLEETINEAIEMETEMNLVNTEGNTSIKLVNFQHCTTCDGHETNSCSRNRPTNNSKLVCQF